ncbi:MAG: hypothetical protein IJR00_08120 [Lachnospiraceae bacterium]|nr:hypothetical protein [Lachnospiraceae bacterium]
MSDLHIEECEKLMNIYNIDFEEAAEMLELFHNIMHSLCKIASTLAEGSKK